MGTAAWPSGLSSALYTSGAFALMLLGRHPKALPGPNALMPSDQ